MLNIRYYFSLAVGVRVAVALLTRSFFQPDEHYQSLEVAHHLVFGYGHLTWEWLYHKPIRSVIYPALNAPIYWVLKVLRLDDTYLLIWGPRILHGMLAACTDIWLCKLARVTAGEKYVLPTYILSLTSFFHALALSRSLSNSLETSLTTIALSYYPWKSAPSWRADTRLSLAFAALACAIRPTNAILWLYVYGILFWRMRGDMATIRALVLDTLIVASVAGCGVAVIDTVYYGKPTFTPLNFLLTNLSTVSLFYGSNPWHFYLFQAFPILCTTALPFVLHGAWLTVISPTERPLQMILGLVVWTITIYSTAGHKEWRFIHPLLPLLHILAAKSLVDSSRGYERSSFRAFSVRRIYMWVIMAHLPALLYIVWYHARAQVDVMYYLRSLPPEDVKSIGFLMPCHSTPWQAYLHRPEWSDDGHYWSIGCEPPLGGEDLAKYKDQAAVFFSDPIAYLQTRFPSHVDPSFPKSVRPFSIPGANDSANDWSHEWPQYIAMFGALLRDSPGVRVLLQDQGYAVVWDQEYGWDGDDSRRGGVNVWRYHISAVH